MDNPVFHKFVVFSKVDREGEIIPSLSKCNNCGVIHKIVDFCKSEIAHGIDDSMAISSEEDIREFLNERLSSILENHKCDTATWEQVADIVSSEEWGAAVVISKHTVGDSTQVKKLLIKASDAFKIETVLRDDTIG